MGTFVSSITFCSSSMQLTEPAEKKPAESSCGSVNKSHDLVMTAKRLNGTDTLGRELVIRSVISNEAVARTAATLEPGDIIKSVNRSDVAGLETEKAHQLIRNHSFRSTKIVLVYLPSADEMAMEKATTIEHVPSSARLSDGGNVTDATTGSMGSVKNSRLKSCRCHQFG